VTSTVPATPGRPSIPGAHASALAVGALAPVAGVAVGGGDLIVPDNWRGIARVLGAAVVLVAVLVRGTGARG